MDLSKYSIVLLVLNILGTWIFQIFWKEINKTSFLHLCICWYLSVLIW